MNNNNRGNNRRRGRGNRQSGGGGGQQLNRIDSRARGNAPQLLEKYRKLAQDAHLNGDRVQAEYYLQFADHYFRVIADARLRQEEQRSRAQGERWQDSGEEGEDSHEFAGDGDFPSFDQPSYNRQPREDRPRRDDRDDDNRGNRQEPAEAEAEGEAAGDEAAANPYEPPQNPFVRENRGTRGLRPRREDRRPRRDDAGEGDSGEQSGLDPTLLPPAIATVRDDAPQDADLGEEAAPAKPRRGRPRKKPSADDAGETLESVN
ncbi:uncharacterized protein DUF4167 [Novosphingobium kunmingense]|uniref:Uncharacterized protein DUF4167 n=1 Tax=Novosphingobium kunmingense TaxID=1211806 RepID=A0A2N0HJZ3_9SPHN|nr:DUF4167 domain-containing protein [Novosphingobium kunmingense]PKB19272.1 uncharacterized protein DUF4167 [Novosphingobium kunmingense]